MHFLKQPRCSLDIINIRTGAIWFSYIVRQEKKKSHHVPKVQFLLHFLFPHHCLWQLSVAAATACRQCVRRAQPPSDKQTNKKVWYISHTQNMEQCRRS